jgi:hypothetical protein
MSTNNDGPSFFARYINDPPEKERREKQHPKSPPIEKLLNWLVNYWTKPTISARDIYTYGPHPIRNQESAVDLAEILVRHGWLAPIKSRRRDMREWQIVLQPNRSQTAAKP